MAATIALIAVTGMYGSPQVAKPTEIGLCVIRQNIRIPHSILRLVPSAIPRE